MNHPGSDAQPLNNGQPKGLTRLQWIVLGLVLAAIVLRERLAALFMWSLLIGLVLFTLFVLPAIVGAATGSVTGEVIRRVKRLRVRK